jgi:glutamate formiminotransferase/formiminotetrahydrofolate cyclodeaminase
MQKAFESMEIIKAMVEVGNPNSVTDAGVGALCSRTAVMGAFLNVKINAAGLEDKKFAKEILGKGKAIEEQAQALENEILTMVNGKIK